MDWIDRLRLALYWLGRGAMAEWLIGNSLDWSGGQLEDWRSEPVLVPNWQGLTFLSANREHCMNSCERCGVVLDLE